MVYKICVVWTVNVHNHVFSQFSLKCVFMSFSWIGRMIFCNYDLHMLFIKKKKKKTTTTATTKQNNFQSNDTMNKKFKHPPQKKDLFLLYLIALIWYQMHKCFTNPIKKFIDPTLPLSLQTYLRINVILL